MKTLFGTCLCHFGELKNVAESQHKSQGSRSHANRADYTSTIVCFLRYLMDPYSSPTIILFFPAHFCPLGFILSRQLLATSHIGTGWCLKDQTDPK